ncbi:liver-expressed antimicrobial peptide 2-like [Chelmon rostratus]|uniref:liver-expressed antimicrobial peptide 2-like n=1 Tax=Chelmon rostratus TaxID=109905 RepID=UPI001BEA42C7|nr:liver-expressed antimicrobial peptide 2-like [Chelmon rostratus]
MPTLQERIIIASILVSLICTIQVISLPVREDIRGLLQRTKRSLLWRWNSMKPVGTSCMYHSECGTKYCRKNICSFWIST